MTYQSEVLADSPLAYWRLNESAANAADAMGGPGWPFGVGVTGSLSPLLADGGFSVRGSGTAPICTRPSIPTGLTAGSVSVEMWVNIPAANVSGPIVKIGNTQTNGWGVGVGGSTWDNTGRQLILLNEAIAWVPTGYNLATGTHHVVVTRSSGNAFTVYVDGASVYTTSFTPNAATGGVGVGGYSTRNLSSTVGVDNVALYASVLSSARVTAHYNSGSGSNTAVAADSPAAWLKLDDTTLTPPTTLADASGNSRSATVAGSPTFGGPSAATYIDGTSATLATGQYGSVTSPAWANSLGAMSVEAWFKSTSATTQALVSQDNIDTSPGTTTRKFALYLESTGKLTWIAFTSSGGFPFASTSAAYNDGNWHHVVATRTSTTLTIYVDGASVATQSISGTLTGSDADLLIGAVKNAGGAGAWPLNGSIDEVAVYSGALSASRVSAHYTAATTPPAGITFDGAVAAVSAVDGTVTAGLAVDGQVDAVSAVAGTASATLALSGQVDAVTDVQGAFLSGVEFSIDGQVDVVSGVDGTLGSVVPLDGQADATSAVDGDLTVSTGLDGQVDAVSGVEGTIVVPELNTAEFEADSALDVAPLADMAGLLDVAEFTATGSLDAGALHSIDIVPDVTAGGDSWLRVIDELDVALDPVTGRPQYKLVAVDKFGTPIAELDYVVMGTATRSLNGRGGFGFTLGKTDPKLPYVPQYAEVQLWRGRNLVPGGWFVITDPAISEGADSFDHQCAGLYWYFEGRLVGKERPELLRNGGFEQGSRFWDFSYSPGSNAETPPKWEITDEACEGGKALRVFADDKVVEFKRTVETQGVFVANSSTFLSGGEQFIRDAIADIPQKQSITIEGHTADADGGTGYALSVARANAAKSVALATRPDLTVTAVGMGETQQIASNATEAGRRKNRRVVIRANFTATKVGHRQFVGQSFTISNPASNREPLEIDVQGQGRIDAWEGPSKDGWMLYADVRPVGKPKVIKNNGSVNIDETSARGAWLPLHTTVEIPADGVDYQVNVRGYPTAGATSFDQMSAMPNLKLMFWQKDPQQVITGLVSHAQDPAFGKSDLNIQTFGNWSGFKIDRAYAWKEHIRVSDAIDEVVRSLNGPDANMLVTARRRWLVCAPKQGHETGIVLAAGDRIGDARILGYESGVDGDTVATTAIVQSSWSGGGMSEVFARKGRTDGLVLERLYQAEQDAPVSTLTEQAATAVEYGRAGLITKVSMHPDDTTYLMSHVTIGDVVTVDVHDSQVQVRADHRIIQIDLDPNLDQLTYTLAPKE